MVSTSGYHVFMEHQVSRWGWGGWKIDKFASKFPKPPERRFRSRHRSWYYCAVKYMYIDRPLKPVLINLPPMELSLTLKYHNFYSGRTLGCCLWRK